MADNTTLYIIIGIVLLLAVMNTNAQPSATGGPAMSAYLRRRATMPEFIETGVPTMPQVLNQPKTQQYIQYTPTMPPQYLRADLSLKVPTKYIQPKLQGQLF
jgi:hypothetical protein